MNKIKYIFFFISLSLVGQDSIKNNKILSIIISESSEYSLIESPSNECYFFQVTDAHQKSEVFEFPIGPIHDFHRKNTPSFFVTNDSLTFHFIDFGYSAQHDRKKIWNEYLVLMTKEQFIKFQKDFPEIKEKPHNSYMIRNLIRAESNSFSTPLKKQFERQSIYEFYKQNNHQQSEETLDYSFLKNGTENLLILNHEGILRILSLDDSMIAKYIDEPLFLRKHWDEKKDLVSKDLNGKDFKEKRKNFDVEGVWDLILKTPFPSGPIRSFTQSNKNYLIAINSDEVFKIDEDSKILKKVAQLPSGFSKEATLIIDKDADEVYIAPQMEANLNAEKRAEMGSWRENAVNVLKDFPLENIDDEK